VVLGYLVQCWLWFHLQEWVEDNWEPPRPILYKVGIGMGYLELPQGMLIGMITHEH